jgi:hypothetical protein
MLSAMAAFFMRSSRCKGKFVPLCKVSGWHSWRNKGPSPVEHFTATESPAVVIFTGKALTPLNEQRQCPVKPRGWFHSGAAWLDYRTNRCRALSPGDIFPFTPSSRVFPNTPESFRAKPSRSERGRVVPSEAESNMTVFPPLLNGIWDAANLRKHVHSICGYISVLKFRWSGGTDWIVAFTCPVPVGSIR